VYYVCGLFTCCFPIESKVQIRRLYTESDHVVSQCVYKQRLMVWSCCFPIRRSWSYS